MMSQSINRHRYKEDMRKEIGDMFFNLMNPHFITDHNTISRKQIADGWDTLRLKRK